MLWASEVRLPVGSDDVLMLHLTINPTIALACGDDCLSRARAGVKRYSGGSKPFQVYIRLADYTKTLGYYATPEEAAMAYDT